ncbi:maleylpyruvate isomerase family mycothiol-dependent enzyme [Amycolatopsis rhabdoformis]|uniref:Maleylpyruvate isomerase family mycothiol-dependent enzyme n=1 Tax=Amycolatopsis rhabdoformis TaxID=1448059 RepID=A0ABZ1IMU5_9PSEU|nr:maleylpyruvate isomerase family mycothiol-dependent enzyme [Amycolatopsis rhabdoformis]WSE35028.1 maleylpyruvate isomerase family mycothiol-dependent enzyme [Amycolatopsis rhabdoformis]
MTPTRLATALRHHTAALAAAAATTDPDARVPTCPDWPVRVLVGHVGQAHRWAASIIRTGPSAVPDPFTADPGSPSSWPAWLSSGAAELIDAVSTSDTPVWTFFGEGPATFWLRRMLNDTLVHHSDAAGATFSVAPDLADDAITEWLELLAHPVTATLKPDVTALRGTGQTLQLAPDDGPGWHLTRTPSGISWTRDSAPADATLAGSLRDLLLVFTRRLPVDQVRLTGDRALIDHWLAHSAA